MFKPLILFKIVILVFIYLGLFVFPVHTYIETGALPMMAGAQRTESASDEANKIDDLCRILLVILMSLILIIIGYRWWKEDKDKKFMELAVLGVGIGWLAAVASAFSIGSTVETCQVALSI